MQVFEAMHTAPKDGTLIQARGRDGLGDYTFWFPVSWGRPRNHVGPDQWRNSTSLTAIRTELVAWRPWQHEYAGKP